MFRIIGKIGATIYCSGIILATAVFTINDANKNLVREVTIEAGSDINISDFFNECPEDARFVTDVSGIDTGVPAIYKLKVFFGETFEKDVTLKIEDHTAPKGIALPKMQYASLEWPDASECVGYLYDLSGIAKIEYLNGVPNYQYTGDYTVPVVVTDWYNNSTVIDVPFHVIDDHNAPLFYGIHDIYIDDSEDASIDYFSGVTWKDDYDEHPRVIVDSSKVKIGEEGIYEITYKALDEAGNVRRQTAKVNITKQSVINSVVGCGGAWDSPDHNENIRIAKELVKQLKGKTDMETARNIVDWVHSHVNYEIVMGCQTYEEAVFRAFTKHTGDCYGFYSCTKMLLDCAGIPNMMVFRDTSCYQGHYWNLVKMEGEWYHCDSTMFLNHPSVYFMQDDKQIGDTRHKFNGSMLPARAGSTPEYITEHPSDEE